MKYDDYELKFSVDKYNEDNSTYIGALVMENGNPVDLYADVTICVPHTTLGGEDVVLNINDEKELINAMVEEGLLVITPYIGMRTEHCNYPKGKLTKKFFDEVYGDKVKAYVIVFSHELRDEY